MAFRFLSGAILAMAVTMSAVADPPKQAEPPEHQSPSLKKAIDPNLLLGKWVRTDNFVGTTMEYYKNGTYLTNGINTRKTQPNGMMGTWKRDGNRLIQTLGPFRTNTSVTIKKLTETEFIFTNHAGQDVTYERVRDEMKVNKRK
jgi:uncharacterized protein (TIGR03066 family)